MRLKKSVKNNSDCVILHTLNIVREMEAFL